MRQVHFIMIISIINSACLSVLHSRAKFPSLPMPYDPPKLHQFFPGVSMLSQASSIIGTRSCSEASLPAAGTRAPFVRRARPLSLRRCVHLSIPCHSLCDSSYASAPFLQILYSPSSSIPSSQNNNAKQKASKQLATLSSVPAPSLDQRICPLYSTDPSHLLVRHQATPAITHQSALNSNIAEWLRLVPSLTSLVLMLSIL
jgi:hypothetical protein